MSGARVRPATLADVPAVASLHLRTAVHAYAHIFPAEAEPPTVDELSGQWRAFVRKGRAFVAAFPLAEDPEALVGTVVAAREDDGLGLVARLYVAPEWWGRGVGRTLHDRAVERLRSAGCAAARLWVLEANDRARAWYERMGWRPSGARKPVYEPAGIDDVEYRLAIAGR